MLEDADVGVIVAACRHEDEVPRFRLKAVGEHRPEITSEPVVGDLQHVEHPDNADASAALKSQMRRRVVGCLFVIERYEVTVGAIDAVIEGDHGKSTVDLGNEIYVRKTLVRPNESGRELLAHRLPEGILHGIPSFFAKLNRFQAEGLETGVHSNVEKLRDMAVAIDYGNLAARRAAKSTGGNDAPTGQGLCPTRIDQRCKRPSDSGARDLIDVLKFPFGGKIRSGGKFAALDAIFEVGRDRPVAGSAVGFTLDGNIRGG